MSFIKLTVESKLLHRLWLSGDMTHNPQYSLLKQLSVSVCTFLLYFAVLQYCTFSMNFKNAFTIHMILYNVNVLSVVSFNAFTTNITY